MSEQIKDDTILSMDAKEADFSGSKRSKQTQISEAILDNLNNREGFREEFNRVDEEVLSEMKATLDKEIGEKLEDSEIPKDQKARAIVETVIDDLSNRRGLRQGFFDQLFFDDEEVREYLSKHPDAEVSDDQSRSGIVRQLTVLIETLV